MQHDDDQYEAPTGQELDYTHTGDTSVLSNREQAEQLEDQLTNDHENSAVDAEDHEEQDKDDQGEEDDADEEEEAEGSDLKEIFLFTKSLISRTPFVNKKRRKNAITSPVWKFFHV